MNRSKVWLLWMATVAVGAGGCGVEQEAPEPLASEDVGQMAPSIGCETDSQGYQTGRCIFVNYCSVYDSPCQVGIRTNSVFYRVCDTWVNTSRCGVLGMDAPQDATRGH
jgi:hypothetical protein